MNEKEGHIILHAFEKLHKATGIITKFTPALKDKFIVGTVNFMTKNKETLFFIEAKNELRAYHLPTITEQAAKYKPLLVVANTIFPKLKEELRKQKIAYLDGAGNAYINYKDLVIWIDGQKNEERERVVINRAFTNAGLKVVFHLLLDEQLLNLPYRELAKIAEVGLGNINYVMTGLKDLGFILQIDPKRKKLQRKRELLDRWMNGFAEILKPGLHIGNFKFVNELQFDNWKKNRLLDQDTVWGGEPAADLLTNDLNPAKLTIYTTGNKADIMKQFKALPAVDGNIKVYKKFWNYPNQGKNPTAPALLVYVDLMLTGDPRCQEIGKRIFDKYLKNEFK